MSNNDNLTVYLKGAIERYEKEKNTASTARHVISSQQGSQSSRDPGI